MIIKKLLAIALIATGMLSLTACTSDEGTAENSGTDKNVEDTKETEVLKIGTESGYAPFEFKMMVDGEEKIVGFDMDLAYEIGKDLGREVEIIDMPFDSLLLEIQAGNIELAIACINPTEERREAAELSKVYYTSNNAMIVRKDDLEKYSSLESLAGEEISVLSGSSQAMFIKEKMTESKAVDLGTLYDAVEELKAGNVTATAAEKPVAEMNVKRNPELAIAFEFDDPSAEGIVVLAQKGNKEIIEDVNSTIDRVIEDGSLDAYIQKAFEDAASLAEEDAE